MYTLTDYVEARENVGSIKSALYQYWGLLVPQVDGTWKVSTEAANRDLIVGKVYDVLSVEQEWYRVIDESGEDYLYPPKLFEILDDEI